VNGLAEAIRKQSEISHETIEQNCQKLGQEVSKVNAAVSERSSAAISGIETTFTKTMTDAGNMIEGSVRALEENSLNVSKALKTLTNAIEGRVANVENMPDFTEYSAKLDVAGDFRKLTHAIESLRSEIAASRLTLATEPNGPAKTDIPTSTNVGE
jgi:hypothetical protein